jgi:hypothetical protein
VSAEGFRKGSGGVRGVFLPNLIEIIPSEGSLPTGSEVDRLDPFCGSPTRLLSAFLILGEGKIKWRPIGGWFLTEGLTHYLRLTILRQNF